MKKVLLALALTLGVLLPRAQAIPDSLPFLSSIRSEVLDQLTIASNNVAATNNVAVNKKLIKSLQGALKSIDKTKTNYAAGAKTLSVLNKALGRTIVSNEFNPLITNTVNVYVGSLYNILEALEDRVDASYPGKASDAARKALAKFLVALDGANTNSNFLLVLKSLAAATKAEAGAQKATVKAENAPLPPASFKATISGTIIPTFAVVPTKDFPVVAVYDQFLNRLQINGTFHRLTGSGINTRVQSCLLIVGIPNLPDGVSSYQVADEGGKVFISSLVGNGSGGSALYIANSGTLNITVNKAAKTAVGTFNFSGPADSGPSSATCTDGSFSVVWTP